MSGIPKSREIGLTRAVVTLIQEGYPIGLLYVMDGRDLLNRQLVVSMLLARFGTVEAGRAYRALLYGRTDGDL